jgi:hypothetical protein
LIKALPESIAQWCQIYDDEGRERPLILAAAAGYRREFVRMLSLTFPEERFKLPWWNDEEELVIANCLDPTVGVQFALNEIDKVKEQLCRARPELKIIPDTELEDIVEILWRKFESRLRLLEKAGRVKPTKISLRPLATSGYIVFQADRINKAIIEAFAFGAMRQLPATYAESLSHDAHFCLAHSFDSGSPAGGRDYLVGAIGLRERPTGRLQSLLQMNGALAIKAQYALWARAYAETDAAPGAYITLTITQFCDDIGMVRNNGAQRTENKLSAISVLELLTNMELVCIYRPPQGPVQRIRGPIWSRGMLSEELRGYKNIFEVRTVSNQPLWVPKAFSYAPGPFFANEAWREYNKHIAYVGEGLLKLSSDNADKYAVMIGGYLAILARMNGYRKSRIGVRTILEKTGLWAVDREKNPGRMREKLETALERLLEVGVIKDWNVTPYGQGEPTRWFKNWQEQFVIIDWPKVMEKREKILREKKARYVKAALDRKKLSRKIA